MKATIAALAAVLSFAVLAPASSAHLLVHFGHKTGAARERAIVRDLVHVQGSSRWLSSHRRLEPTLRRRLVQHRRAVAWLQRELAATREAMRPRVGWPWLAIADCETGGDASGRPPYRAVWDYNGSSGFDGGIQFDPGTWSAYRHAGEPAFAYLAPDWLQIEVGERVLAAQGWNAWPSCSRSTGIR